MQYLHCCRMLWCVEYSTFADIIMSWSVTHTSIVSYHFATRVRAVLGSFPPISQSTHEHESSDDVITVERGNMAVLAGCQHVPYSRPPPDIQYLLNGSMLATSRTHSIRYCCYRFVHLIKQRCFLVVLSKIIALHNEDSETKTATAR